MKQGKVELININEARNLLSSGGLEHLANLIYKKKTINIGSRTFITRKQFENCVKREVVEPVRLDFIKYESATL